jgi:hypothetical protein
MNLGATNTRALYAGAFSGAAIGAGSAGYDWLMR